MALRKTAWDMLQLGAARRARSALAGTTTPRPIALLKRLIADGRRRRRAPRPRENAVNLAPGFVEAVEARYAGTRLGRQELDGEIVEDRPGGAVDPRESIEAARVAQAPGLARIVVAVDPPASAASAASAASSRRAWRRTGASTSWRTRPPRSARPAPVGGAAPSRSIHAHGADALVAEVNQGGDMVRR